MGCHELSKGRHGGMRAEILQLQIGLCLPAWRACPGGPQGWRSYYAGAERTPLRLLQSSLLGAARCMHRCMVQAISGVWSHLQPSTKAPSCLPPLLPVARLRFLGAHTILASPAAGAQHASLDTGVAAWECPAPPGVPGGHGHVTPTCPSSEPRCECPGCLLALLLAGMGNPAALMQFRALKIYFSGARGEKKERAAQRCPPVPGEELCRAVTPPGNPSEAPCDPAPSQGHAPPRGTTASPCPWPPLPVGLGDGWRRGGLGGRPCGASLLPVKLPLAPQLEFPVVGIDLAALPVPQLDAQGVGCLARQEVHGLVTQPVLARRVPEALGKQRVG